MSADETAGTDQGSQRTFLEVEIPGEKVLRFFQLDRDVKFRNVLKALKRDGTLFWNGSPLLPSMTPLSLGMPCGVKNAVQIIFVAGGGGGCPPMTLQQDQRLCGNAPTQAAEPVPTASVVASVDQNVLLERELQALRQVIQDERERRQELQAELYHLRNSVHRPFAYEAALGVHHKQMEELRRQRARLLFSNADGSCR